MILRKDKLESWEVVFSWKIFAIPSKSNFIAMCEEVGTKQSKMIENFLLVQAKEKKLIHDKVK